ncbi:phosphotransferase family protein [Camelliibacillus cellulosilyticus]|uniref:Phosphotransferase family protein n=1 Tax=Camelliibacillus cellulosilyticus TaxID=2174486 RepID=A0ABV9GLG9_9BACL
MIGERIGKGATADIFTYGEGKIMKLFYPELPNELAQKEFEVSNLVMNLGLPVPKIFSMETIDHRCGIVYEYVKGAALAVELVKNREAIHKYGVTVAELQHDVHKKEPSDMPLQKEVLKRHIKAVNLIDDNMKASIINGLDQLPDGGALCHGDFHPANIMVEGNRFTIIDWMTATMGNPLGDVARTSIILKHVVLPDVFPADFRAAFDKLRWDFLDSYLNEYLRLSGASIKEIEAWELPIMAARLIENLTLEEKKALLAVVRERVALV